MNSLKIDRQIIIFVVLLTAIGLMMVFSVSSFSEIDDARVSYEKFMKQVTWVFVGLIMMFGVSMVSSDIIKKYSFNVMAIAGASLIAVLLFGEKINGAQRWFNFGIVYIQPVEFVKIALVIYLARWLSNEPDKLKDFKKGMAPVMVILALMAGLVILQPDLSSAIILIFTAFIMLFLSPVPFSHMVSVGSIGILILSLVVQSYQKGRILGLMNPEVGPYGDQSTQGLIAIGSGGVWGVGYAASKIKLFFLKAADSDYILAIIGEEFGLFGLTILFFLFFILFMRMLKIVYRSKGDFEYYLAAGLTSILMLHYFINVGVVLRLLPVTGIPLPFISYGGSHILAEFIIIGIMLSLTRGISFERKSK